MTLLGQAAVYGITGTIAFAGPVALTANWDTVSLEDAADRAELRDGTNQIVSVNLTNPQKKVSITFVVTSATSIADAITKGALPTKGSTVVLSSFQDSAFDGNYNYLGGATKEPQKDGFYKITMPLEQFNGSALSAIT